MPYIADGRERSRWTTKAAGLALGLALLASAGATAVLAQDEGITIGGGTSGSAVTSAADVEAIVNSILAEVFGETAVADDAVIDDTRSGGDINVGGNMGGSVTTGGGMGGGISIGGGSSGSVAVE